MLEEYEKYKEKWDAEDTSSLVDSIIDAMGEVGMGLGMGAAKKIGNWGYKKLYAPKINPLFGDVEKSS